MLTIEKTIISNLLNDEEYLRKVSPHIKSEYFKDPIEILFVDKILNFFNKYNEIPNRKTIAIELAKEKPGQEVSIAIGNLLREVNFKSDNQEWLLNETEAFCKQSALYNAILESFSVIDGTNHKLAPDAIPSLLTEALSVSFDKKLGSDYTEDAESRWEYFNREEEKVPFDLKLLNLITQGGMGKKTLTLIAGGTGSGKTLLMSHISARTLLQGYNVLYISMEMSEEKIAQRIDANLMQLNIQDIPNLDKDYYLSKIDKIKAKTIGKLKIKEYPNGTAHSGHFRNLLIEYKQKHGFVPDLLVVDYLSICASSRLKMSSQVNSYTYIKAISEELRALASEFDVPVLSAVQTVRSANVSSDVDVADVAESFGIMHTADVCFAIVRTEELDKLNQMMIKQLKNRYGDLSYYNKFTLGLDRAKMRFYDVESNDEPLKESENQNMTQQITSKFQGINFS